MTRIGRYRIDAVDTGFFGLDGGAMFGVVPKPLWEKRMTPDARNRIRLAMRCMLLRDDRRTILVDNGLGHKYTDKFASLYAVDHESATLARSLAMLGVSVEDVTDVILTHLHFDHAGGSTEVVGDRLEPTFRNARYHTQERQWASAFDPNPREAPSFLEENLQPLQDAGQLVIHNGPTELFEGVSVELFFGHTEAMQTVSVRSDDGTLVFAADLLPTSHHLNAAWTMAYDIRPLETMKEKERFLSRAASEGWTIFFEHDPLVVIADIRQDERGFAAVRQRSLEDLVVDPA